MGAGDELSSFVFDTENRAGSITGNFFRGTAFHTVYQPLVSVDCSWWLGRMLPFWRHWWLLKQHPPSSLQVHRVFLFENSPRIALILYMRPYSVPLLTRTRSLDLHPNQSFPGHKWVWSSHCFLEPGGCRTWWKSDCDPNNPWESEWVSIQKSMHLKLHSWWDEPLHFKYLKFLNW